MSSSQAKHPTQPNMAAFVSYLAVPVHRIFYSAPCAILVTPPIILFEVSYRIVSYRIVSYRIVSCRVVCYVVLSCVLCCVELCVVLCCVVLCYVVLCCVVLCSAVETASSNGGNIQSQFHANSGR